jgi:RNA polymerase sigma-70 factor (ECF subfamily)
MLTLIHRLRSDEALMQAYQRGDASAFETLYHRHKDGLFAFIYRSCPRREAAKELAQETWTAVIDKASAYQPEAAFKTWLYQIARNRTGDYWRRRDNHHQPLEQASEPVNCAAGDDRESLENRLMAAIGQLPIDQRDALLLQQQGFSQQDIAAITGAGEETIKSRLRYARRQLREQLGEPA